MSVEIVLAVLGVVIVGFFFYRSMQRARVARVKSWIEAFLTRRYGALPEDLSIHCTDDQSWPVLVEFRRPLPATRHLMQFMCSGVPSRYRLHSEKEERLRLPSR